MHVPAEEIGRRAAEYFLSRVAGRSAPITTEVMTNLIIRESTAPPPLRRRALRRLPEIPGIPRDGEARFMFSPPPAIQTEVFARIPDKHRISGRTSPWIEAVRGGQATDCFLEGPSFDRAGNLYVVDVAWGRIFRISPAGGVALAAEYDGEPNGLKIHRDGRIFIADYRQGIMQLDPPPALSAPSSGATGQPFKGVNDLHFAGNGDLYFTDQGHTGLHDPSGRLYRLRANGRLDLVLDGYRAPMG